MKSFRNRSNIWKYRIRRKYDYCSFHSYMRKDKKLGIITQKISDKIKKIIDKLFYYEIWSIGIIESRIEELLKDKDLRIKWLKIKKYKFYQFYADPFGFKWNDNQKYIIYEKFDYRSKIGDIAVSKLDDNFNLIEEKIIISDQIHSSYPYVFSDKNQLYVLTERNKSNTLDLYKMDSPDKLVRIKTLLGNSRIIDPTIIKHNNIWWIFFTSHEVGDNKLQIAYSDELLGDWKMHPQNPVKFDNSSSRSAGTPFLFDGNLYRPAQNCSKCYGGSIVINKIIKLSKTEFTEEKFKEILPKENNEYNLGIHTISTFEDLTLIDGKKRKFALFKIIISFYRVFFKALKLRRFRNNSL